MDAEFAPHMLYITNEDKPGFIGRLGTLLGDAGVNIANFNLGRSAPGADAIALLQVDEPVADKRPRRNPRAPAGQTGARAGVLNGSRSPSPFRWRHGARTSG